MLAFGLRNGFLGKQLLGSPGIRLGLVQLGGQGFPIVFGGLDFLFARAGFQFGQLRGGLVASGPQLRRVEFRNHLSPLQGVAFGHEIVKSQQVQYFLGTGRTLGRHPQINLQDIG